MATLHVDPAHIAWKLSITMRRDVVILAIWDAGRQSKVLHRQGAVGQRLLIRLDAETKCIGVAGQANARANHRDPWDRHTDFANCWRIQTWGDRRPKSSCRIK